MTLMEVVVVLVILGISTALVTPALLPVRTPDATLDDVIAGARATAIARAQRLQLTVGVTGSWSLGAPGGEVVASGSLATTGGQPLRLELSPLGTCVARSGLPVSWDAARCRAAASVSP